jgi:hypothetical protein
VTAAAEEVVIADPTVAMRAGRRLRFSRVELRGNGSLLASLRAWFPNNIHDAKGDLQQQRTDQLTTTANVIRER